MGARGGRICRASAVVESKESSFRATVNQLACDGSGGAWENDWRKRRDVKQKRIPEVKKNRVKRGERRQEKEKMEEKDEG